MNVTEFVELLPNMVVLGMFNLIPADTPEFQAYALNTMVTNAQVIARAWNLDTDSIAVEKITAVDLMPHPWGINGAVVFDDRYSFRALYGRFDGFSDRLYFLQRARTDDVAQNDAILDEWMRAEDLLTMGRADRIASAALRDMGTPIKEFGLKKKRAIQKKYLLENGEIHPLPYYEFEWEADEAVARIDVSGIEGNIVRFFFAGNAFRLYRPANYFEMLGLPEDPIFVVRTAASWGGTPRYRLFELPKAKE